MSDTKLHSFPTEARIPMRWRVCISGVSAFACFVVVVLGLAHHAAEFLIFAWVVLILILGLAAWQAAQYIYLEIVIKRRSPDRYASIKTKLAEQSARLEQLRSDNELKLYAQNLRYTALNDESNRKARTKARPYLNGPLIPIHPRQVTPRHDEKLYYEGHAVSIVTKKQTEFVRGTTGVSVRIASGLWVHASGSRGHSVAHFSSGRDQSGILAITDQRIFFAGAKSSLEAPLTRIANVKVFFNGIQVDVPNRRALRLTTGSAEAGIILRRIMSNDTGDRDDSSLRLDDLEVTIADKLLDLLEKRERGEIAEEDFEKMRADLQQAVDKAEQARRGS